MNLQFHLTNSCNLRCIHCYQGEYTAQHISLDNFLLVLGKTKRFFDEIGNPVYTILLTGGEPLCVPHFQDYLTVASSFCSKLSLLSNGTLLTKRNLSAMCRVKNFFRIQVSLEGPEEINDSVRGKGTYKKIRKAIRLINEAGLRSVVSCTLAPYNYDKIVDLYDDLVSYDSPNALWFDRCIPFKGNGVLTTEQFSVFLQSLVFLRNRWKKEHLLTEPLAVRALQWMAMDSKDKGYSCGAGLGHFTLMPNGDVMLCRRLDFPVGNLLVEDWSDIFPRIVPILQKVHALPDDCAGCKFGSFCNGGLKCLTYALHHHFNRKDVNCLC